MIALIACFVAVAQEKLDVEIERAIRNVPLDSEAFDKALEPIFHRFAGWEQGDGFPMASTQGDERGVWLTATDFSGARHEHIFIWPDGKVNHAQTVYRYWTGSSEAKDLPMSPEGEVYWRGDRLVIAGQDQRFFHPSAASLYSYRLQGGRWKLIQHLYLGLYGEAKFAQARGKVDPNRVLVEVSGLPYHLDVPQVGPYLDFKEEWLYRGGKYVRRNLGMVPTATAELDRLGGYAESHNRSAFNRRVPPALRKDLWKALSENQSVDYDDKDPRAFLIGEHLRVTITKVRGRWTVTRVQKVASA